MDSEQERALVPKWAEDKAERGVKSGEEAVQIFREVAADFKRLVDHLTRDVEP